MRVLRATDPVSSARPDALAHQLILPRTSRPGDGERDTGTARTIRYGTLSRRLSNPGAPAGNAKWIAVLCPPPSCVLGRAAYDRCYMDTRRARQGTHPNRHIDPTSRHGSHTIRRCNEATRGRRWGPRSVKGIRHPRPGFEQPIRRDESFSDGRLRAVGRRPPLFHVKPDS